MAQFYASHRDGHMNAMAQSLPEEQRYVINVDAVGRINVDNSYLVFRGWDDPINPGRPYLCLSGRVGSLVCGDLPYGVDTLVYDDDSGQRVDVFYEFSDEQLSSLVNKGLFTPQFSLPDELKDIEGYEVAVNTDIEVIEPDKDDDIPVFLTKINNPYNISDNAEDGLYDLAQLFPDTPHKGEEDLFDNDFQFLEEDDDLFDFDDERDIIEEQDLLFADEISSELEQDEQEDPDDVFELDDEETRLLNEALDIYDDVDKKMRQVVDNVDETSFDHLFVTDPSKVEGEPMLSFDDDEYIDFGDEDDTEEDYLAQFDDFMDTHDADYSDDDYIDDDEAIAKALASGVRLEAQMSDLDDVVDQVDMAEPVAMGQTVDPEPLGVLAQVADAIDADERERSLHEREAIAATAIEDEKDTKATEPIIRSTPLPRSSSVFDEMIKARIGQSEGKRTAFHDLAAKYHIDTDQREDEDDEMSL